MPSEISRLFKLIRVRAPWGQQRLSCAAPDARRHTTYPLRDHPVAFMSHVVGVPARRASGVTPLRPPDGRQLPAQRVLPPARRVLPLAQRVLPPARRVLPLAQRVLPPAPCAPGFSGGPLRP